MTNEGTNITPDEQLYQSNKSEPELKKVYDHEPDRATASVDQGSPDEIAPGLTQDEASAESFPASDPPAPMASTSILATEDPHETEASDTN